MNSIIPFSFKSQNVRVAVIDGEPWWVAKDVCEVLDIANHRDAISKLEDDERRDDVGITDAIGREQRTTVICESGLYKLIFTSRKPEAKEFIRWLSREVIPSIRRTGSYSTAQLPSTRSPIGILKAREEFEAAVDFVKLFGITDPNQSLFAANNMVRGFYGIAPLDLAGCAMLPAPKQEVSMTPTELGEELGGMHPREVNKLLESIGLQTRVAKEWIATERGEEHTVRVDVQKRHNSGTPCTQLRWYSTVIDVLRDALNQRRAGATAGTRASDDG
jgi:hypothetical protein